MDLTRSDSDQHLAPGELYSNEYKLMLEEIVDKYSISFIHIHHILWHYFDVVDVCLNNKIEYAVSLHDVYMSFPIANRFAVEVDGKIKATMDEETWRSVCKKLLKNAKYLIAPSKVIADEYKKVYGKMKVRVIGHGTNIKRVNADHVLGTGRKNIAFVGGIAESKGSKIMEALLPVLEKRGNVNVHLYGLTVADVSKSKIFIDHGIYNREDLPQLMKQDDIDLVCNFSLSLESYAYVVDEVAASGLPSLAFDFGAGAKRIKEYNLGWTMKYTDDVQVIAKEIERILSDEKKYSEVIESINRYDIRSVEEMAGDYDAIYAQNVKKTKLDYKVLKNSLMIVDVVDRAEKNADNNRRRAENVEREYSRLVRSVRWNLVSGIKLPKWLTRVIGEMRNINE